jgi:hypothetical protein
MIKPAFIKLSVVVLLPLATFAQTFGTAKAPEDLLKATLLIETAESRSSTKYLPWGIYKKEGEKTIQVSPTNLVVQVQQPETIFHPAGSGVLVTRSNVNLFATAKHVVQQNEDVFFRIPQKNGGSPDHRPHRSMKALTGVGWIYATNADVALTILIINEKVDDVSFIPLDAMAASYGAVSVGDDLFVSGFPSSVIELDAPALRNGMVSAKLPDAMILIDTTTFPGNSGGPVFWKPTMGLNIYGNQIGQGRPASLVGLALYSALFTEGAVSPTSGRTRVVFEANSGLTKIVSTSRILEVLDYPETRAAIARALGNK